jgi:rhodanese-related sulfurtransferase
MAKQHAPGFLNLVESVRPKIRECTVADLKAKIDQAKLDNMQVHIVDVREESEFTAGHIPGAVHLSKGIIERDVEGVFPNLASELYLYCGGGFRSALVADNLQKMGYTQITSVDGGWRSWTENGYPTTC